MKLREIAHKLGAELRPGGDQIDAGEIEVSGITGIDAAGPDQISFIANPKYIPLAKKTRAAALLVEPEFAHLTVPTLRIKNPYLAFSCALRIFHPAPTFEPGIHNTAIVPDSVVLGERVHLGPYVVIGENCTIGDDSAVLAHAVIYPNVSIGRRALIHSHAVVREGCTLGDDVILQNGVVIGADGFGFAKDGHGKWNKIAQPSPVLIEDEVEVQANSCIDRASVGGTRIARGTKIDNLVQVGHGSYVGENSLLCAQVGLAGSTTTGRNVTLAGQVGVVGHLTIADGAIVTAQSGVTANIAAGSVVSGSPAIDNRTWTKNTVVLNRLAETLKRLKKHD